MKRRRIVSRNFEMIFGFIGSVIAILTGSFLIFLQNFGNVHTSFLGVLSIVASIIGLICSYYVRKNAEIAGIGFIIATVLIIAGAEHISILSAIFLLVAGVSALFRK